MHNGALPTLRAVVQHYSELDEERLHLDGSSVLRPFLDTLSDGSPEYQVRVLGAESTCLSRASSK